MEKVELKRGDYVYVGDQTSDVIRSLVYVFESHGAIDVDEGDFKQEQFPWLVWDSSGDVWCCNVAKDGEGRRELTIAQVLGEDETAMPEVGSRWLLECGFDDIEEVEVIAERNGDAVVEIVSTGAVHKVDPCHLKPLKSERDKAVEGMARSIAKRHVVEAGEHYDVDRFLCYADELYTDGYRKVEL